MKRILAITPDHKYWFCREVYAAIKETDAALLRISQKRLVWIKRVTADPAYREQSRLAGTHPKIARKKIDYSVIEAADYYSSLAQKDRCETMYTHYVQLNARRIVLAEYHQNKNIDPETKNIIRKLHDTILGFLMQRGYKEFNKVFFKGTYNRKNETVEEEI